MKVLVLPKDPNPYQYLLYGNMADGVEIEYLTGLTRSQTMNLLLLPYCLALQRLRGFKVLHLHWTYTFVIPKLNHKLVKLLAQEYCVACLCFIKLLGYKLVWTAHDSLPHSNQFYSDLAVNKKLGRLADVVIVHSSTALDQLNHLGVKIRRSVSIPHGNYIGFYPDNISRPEARRLLNVKKDDIVILFFGLVRPYKGVDDLLAAFRTIKHPKVRLIIAGRCIDRQLSAQIEKATQRDDRVSFHNAYIRDNEVAQYFKACDLVCLPFKSTTTSGSTLLALSFGKPLVAPKVGSLTDLPDDVGYLYNPSRPEALKEALGSACQEGGHALTKKGANAQAYAEGLSWAKIARMTCEVYAEILNHSATWKS